MVELVLNLKEILMFTFICLSGSSNQWRVMPIRPEKVVFSQGYLYTFNNGCCAQSVSFHSVHIYNMTSTLEEKRTATRLNKDSLINHESFLLSEYTTFSQGHRALQFFRNHSSVNNSCLPLGLFIL